MSQPPEPLDKKVLRYLTTYPLLRNDDQKLLAMIWRDEIGEKNHTKSNFDILGRIFNRKLSHPESIKEAWKKILRKNPSLRGPKYSSKQEGLL